MARDYYETLGVPRTADEKELKKSFRKLAMQYHPDRNPDNAEAEASFKEVSEAYEVLSDSQKRATYDRFGHDGLKGAGFSPNFHSAEDIFSHFGDIFGDLFGGGGGGRRRPRGPRRGSDLEIGLRVGFLDAVKGGEQNLEVPRHPNCDLCEGSGAKPGSTPEICETCGGRGEVLQQQMFLRMRTTCPACRGQGKIIRERCADCGGQGRVRTTSKLTVTVPPGVDHGMQLRLAGKGEYGDPGGPPGDLYVTIHLKEHEFFQRDGLDIYCTVPMSYPQACLGAEIAVPTVHGEASLSIPPATPSGKVFVLRGEGVPNPTRKNQRGNQHVQVVVEVPKKLSAEEKELISKLAESQDQKVGRNRKGFFREFLEGLSG